MVGGGGRSRQRGHAKLGARAQEGRREGWGRLEAHGKGLGGQRRKKRRGAVGRVVTASPWRFGGHPRRARRGRRRVARPSGVGTGLGDPGGGEVVWPGRAARGRRPRLGRRRTGEGERK